MKCPACKGSKTLTLSNAHISQTCHFCFGEGEIVGIQEFKDLQQRVIELQDRLERTIACLANLQNQVAKPNNFVTGF